MIRISKDPQVRKKELIDVAEKLFLEKGYEAVAVRDILKVINGTPGMFYYYFESKQDIYKAAMDQYIDNSVISKAKILKDKSLPLPIRMQKVMSLIKINFQECSKAFNSQENHSFETMVFMNMLDLLADPVADAILDAKEQGLAKNSIIQDHNARELALFILHGIYGLLHDVGENGISVEIANNNMQYIVPFICSILGMPTEKFEKE